MATGTGPLAANAQSGVTNITPSVDLPSTADLWASARESAKRFDAVIVRGLEERALRRGAREGLDIAAGKAESPSGAWRAFEQFTDAGRARAEARRAGYVAGARNSFDTEEKSLRDKHLYDPDAYKAETDKLVSKFIQEAPPEFAVEVEAYAQGRVTNGLEVVTTARRGKDEREQAATLTARVEKVTGELKDLAALPGGEQSERFTQLEAELSELLRQKVENPLFAYTAEQADLALEKVHDELGGIFVTRDALAEYGESGGGMAGYAAAKRWLSDEFLNGEEFKKLPPERRARYAREATRSIEAAFAGDRAKRQLEREEQAAADRERRDRKEAYQLDILLGDASETDILADDVLDDGDKASLVKAARTQRRQERADREREARLAKLENRQVYNDLHDLGERGRLQEGDIASAVSAGFITKADAATLRSLNVRANKHDMDLLTKDAKAEIDSRPGWSAKRKKEEKANVDRIAAETVRATPDADAATRQRQATQLTGMYKPKAGAGANDRAARLRALEARRPRMKPGDYQRERKKIIDGN